MKERVSAGEKLQAKLYRRPVTRHALASTVIITV